MSPRRKPLEYPTRKYHHNERRLKNELRRLYRRFIRGRITKEIALDRGIRVLQAHYYRLIDEFNQWSARQNLRGRVSGREAELRETLTKAEAEWRGIVADM